MIYGIKCKFAIDSGRQDVIVCSIGRFGGRPHAEVCKLCLEGHPDTGPVLQIGRYVPHILGEPIQKAPNEPICKHRGEVTKTIPCCGGKTRPIEVECKHEEVSDRIPFGTCNSVYCKFYEIEEKAMKGSSYATRL